MKKSLTIFSAGGNISPIEGGNHYSDVLNSYGKRLDEVKSLMKNIDEALKKDERTKSLVETKHQQLETSLASLRAQAL